MGTWRPLGQGRHRLHQRPDLASGVGDKLFAPDLTATRAQLWTILARMNGETVTGGQTWYELPQLWAKKNGVSDGTDPNGTITRAQLVTMLWRTAGSPTAGSETKFTDVPADKRLRPGRGVGGGQRHHHRRGQRTLRPRSPLYPRPTGHIPVSEYEVSGT
ncbi:MAG: hypothetical protein V8S34_01340 [Lawsonibacter sp.]